MIGVRFRKGVRGDLVSAVLLIGKIARSGRGEMLIRERDAVRFVLITPVLGDAFDRTLEAISEEAEPASMM